MFDKIILHVGLHKTGTTSLQNYFGHNRKTLSSLGVLYPALSVNSYTPDNHSWPIRNLTMLSPEQYHLNIMHNVLGQDLIVAIESLNKQFLALGDKKESTLLLSGEGISTLKVKELTKLKEKLLSISKKEVCIEIHYFTRNATSYISSIVQQRLKGGTKEDIILTSLAKISPFKSFLNRNLFKRVFTDAFMKEHRYEQACAHAGGLEAYFTDNILNVSHTALPYIPERENSGLSHIAFQLIRYYLNHSTEYVRVPLEGSGYYQNIKLLSQIKGDKFMMTNEQKDKLIARIEKKEHEVDWTAFFEGNPLPSESDCWIDFDVTEVKQQLCNINSECRQLLLAYFNDLVVTQGPNKKVSLLIEHLLYLNKPRSLLVKLKSRTIRGGKKVIGFFKRLIILNK